MALLVGWIVTRLDEQRATAEQRAEEAEALRDELGRRADCWTPRIAVRAP